MNMLSYLPATESDIPVIFGLAKGLIDDYEDKTSIPYEEVLDWMRRKISKQIDRYTCVYKDGEKAGYFCLTDGEEKAELDDLYVLEPFRNRGIGTCIIRHCQETAGKPIFLYVFVKNIRAAALYERLGFSVTEQVSPTRNIMTWNG